MKIYPPVIDYRKFRFCKLNTPEFSYLKWLIFWPIYAVMFLYVERIYPVDTYTEMWCPLDDRIPFCEFFVIPYMFWFVYMVGMYLYTLFYDVPTFRKLMKFTVITISVTIMVYLIFPTCQNLRPVEFERDNILTRFMAEFYRFDTNTNVCPSIHVIGSIGIWAAGWNAPKLQKIRWKAGFTGVTILICLSTVFLKQHSVIDVMAALPICAAAYRICYQKTPQNTDSKRSLRSKLSKEKQYIL